jgi:hypothetical protein
MALLFSDTGTLLEWHTPQGSIIHPLTTFTETKKRGGAFLCIPNFEELNPPFAKKHGEYRNTLCTPAPPHVKKIEPEVGGVWGSVDTLTEWSEECSGNISTLTVISTITATQSPTLIRPGFHPYFTTKGTFSVSVADSLIDNDSLIHDTPVHIKTDTNNGHASAVVTTDKYKIEISLSMSSLPQNQTPNISFTVWSDNSGNYICVEPSFGSKYISESKLPEPIHLESGDVVSATFTVCVTNVAQ